MRFRSRNIGLKPVVEVDIENLTDLRSHPMFSHWEPEYQLQVSGNAVKMVKSGHSYYEGMVVGFIVKDTV